MSILLAEDDPLNAMALLEQLEILGFTRCAVVRDGVAAVARAKVEPFDLAVLDVRMPRKSGLEAAEEIFREKPLPIILLTGYADAESVSRATVLPVFHHKSKPLTLEELGPAIGEARRAFAEWMERGGGEMPDRSAAADELVRRATELLAETRGIPLGRARRHLKRYRRRENKDLTEAARTVLIAELFAPGSEALF